MQAHNLLGELKKREGHVGWEVLVEKNGGGFEVVKRVEDWPPGAQGEVLPSMFAPNEVEKFGLERTVRIMPHDQDTGGFYVAVLKKKGYVYFDEKYREKVKEGEKEKEGKTGKPDRVESRGKFEKKKTVKGENYLRWADEAEIERLAEYYGIEEKTRSFLYTSQEDGKKIYICAPAVDRYLRSDTSGRLIKVNAGIHAWDRVLEPHSKNSVYRITQEGAESVFGEMSGKRKVQLQMEEMMYVVYNNTIYNDNVVAAHKNLVAFIGLQVLGYYIMYCEREGFDREVIVVQKFATSFKIISDKHTMFSLVIKYEREFPK